MNRTGAVLLVSHLAAISVLVSCSDGEASSPFKEGGGHVNTFSAPVGTVWVLSNLISLWNETEEAVTVVGVSLPDDSGLELLDSRLVPENQPQPDQPVTVDALTALPSIADVTVDPNEKATLFLALRVSTNRLDVSGFDHLSLTLADGRTIRYDDVTLIVCRELDPGSDCPADISQLTSD